MKNVQFDFSIPKNSPVIKAPPWMNTITGIRVLFIIFASLVKEHYKDKQ
jgi:hypothetical protein